MKLKRVVVTGMGAITPIGNNVNDYWEALKSGVSGSDFIKHFDTSKSKTKFACEVKDFNPEDYLDRKEVRKLDLYCVYALVAAAEAIKNSGLNIEAIDKDRAGVIYTSGIGGKRNQGLCYRRWYTKVQPVFYSQNDQRYCCRAHLYQIWFQGA